MTCVSPFLWTAVSPRGLRGLGAMARLDDFTLGVHVRVIVSEALATVISQEWRSRNAITLIHRDAAGIVNQRLLYCDKGPKVRWPASSYSRGRKRTAHRW